jgi:hypothetical protein
MRGRALIGVLALSLTVGLAQPGNAEIPPPPLPCSTSTCVDIVVAMADSPDPVGAGAELAYTIDLSNASLGTAFGVTLTDQIAATRHSSPLRTPVHRVGRTLLSRFRPWVVAAW